MSDTEAPEAKPRYSWTQPSCTDCWIQNNSQVDDESGGLLVRQPTVFRDPDAKWEEQLEACVHCGRATTSGIFIRIDPAEALHPTKEKD